MYNKIICLCSAAQSVTKLSLQCSCHFSVVVRERSERVGGSYSAPSVGRRAGSLHTSPDHSECPHRDSFLDWSFRREISAQVWRVSSPRASSAIKCQLGAKSHSLKLPGSKGLLIQVFIIFFHSLHKPATLVQIHTQHRGRAGPWWRLMGSVQATLAANQVRFPGTELYTSLCAPESGPRLFTGRTQT